MYFSIVTPVFNGSRFIDETILSVVTQAGSFGIRYHVQDGGSTDGTLDKLARWKARLAEDFPLLCEGVTFSYASESDRGMYDAVNRGFAACGTADVLSWINADDRLAPGALAVASDLFTRFRDIDWLTGRSNLVDEAGAAFAEWPLIPYPREAIAAGVFDGRMRHFIQQEGTFWRSWLWERTGGADVRFRLAGDFDLWRRFAEHADLVVVDTMLGSNRRRAGQATEDISSYHAEIDALLPGNAVAQQAIAARLGGRLAYRKVVRPYMGDWVCEQMPKKGVAKLEAIWRRRRHLPSFLSIRDIVRRVRNWPLRRYRRGVVGQARLTLYGIGSEPEDLPPARHVKTRDRLPPDL
jgi:glycosyltransferase involved in cell wall biosynthesis